MEILFLDIETAPLLADVWGLFDQNVGLNQIRDPGGLLCYSAKWRGNDEMYFHSDHHSGRPVMVEVAHRLLDQADVVVTWNGARFDVPHLNREFLEMGLKPPSPFKQVDLYRAVRRVFKFPSNKLQYVSTALGLDGKVEHEGHLLWVKCMMGDEDAWRRMQEYNRQDVILLEQLYDRLLPWIPNHPSMALDHDGECCPKCSSTRLQKRGTAQTLQSSFQRYQCQDCGGWFRSTKRDSATSIREVAS